MEPACTPGISVLKPIHGLEAELFENLCSFCEQQYPQYQVVFGMQRSDDPARAIVQRVLERYPDRDLALVVDETPLPGNPKMASVAKMMHAVKHPIVAIVDADMRVDEQYLRAIAGAFGDDSAGAATCLYAADPRGGAASNLAAAGINEQFAPSVLVATAFAPLSFAFGSTMAVRRDVLAQIGGVEALAPHLADDYMLGALVATHGYRVALSPYVVRNVIREERIGDVWHHELRWARTIRLQRPAGYAFSAITYPLPFALLAWCFGGGVAAATLIAFALLLRLLLHNRMRELFAQARPTSAWLIPLRDGFGLAIWAASFFGRAVRWQRADLMMDRAGRLS